MLGEREVLGPSLVVVGQDACKWRPCWSDRARGAHRGGLKQSAPQSSPEGGKDTEDALEGLVEWLIANGVRGLGGEDSSVALYDDDCGMRGVICLKVRLLRLPRPTCHAYMQGSMQHDW